MHHKQNVWAVFALTSIWSLSLITAQDDLAPVQKNELGTTRNVHSCEGLFLSGQPSQQDVKVIKEQGIKRVISLRQEGEIDWQEGTVVQDAGLEFVAIPFAAPDTLTDQVFDQVRKLLQDSAQTPTLLHCGSANRVGAVWLTHRVLDQGVPLEVALKEARQIGLRTPAYEERAKQYIKVQAEPKSVRPGINKSFLDTSLDVDEWIGRFEIESREVFAARADVVRAVAVRSGDRIADIGAGTGFFTQLFSRAVGEDGWVFAVDISPRFVEHLNQLSTRSGLRNVTTVLCPDKSVSLPPQSVDVAFICDTYHHFEFPESTLDSIHRALRPGGRLIVIDFDRIPGTSSEFVMGHVRAGKQVFRGEIEAAGFAFDKQVEIDTFKENYFLQFHKK